MLTALEETGIQKLTKLKVFSTGPIIFGCVKFHSSLFVVVLIGTGSPRQQDSQAQADHWSRGSIAPVASNWTVRKSILSKTPCWSEISVFGNSAAHRKSEKVHIPCTWFLFAHQWLCVQLDCPLYRIDEQDINIDELARVMKTGDKVEAEQFRFMATVQRKVIVAAFLWSCHILKWLTSLSVPSKLRDAGIDDLPSLGDIEVLNLRRCSLEWVDFSEFKSLRRLVLSHNYLTNITLQGQCEPIMRINAFNILSGVRFSVGPIGLCFAGASGHIIQSNFSARATLGHCQQASSLAGLFMSHRKNRYIAIIVAPVRVLWFEAIGVSSHSLVSKAFCCSCEEWTR